MRLCGECSARAWAAFHARPRDRSGRHLRDSAESRRRDGGTSADSLHAQDGINYMEGIRILIADDQAITRSGLQTMLAAHQDMQVIGEARDGKEVVELAASLQPDVILMDVRMPGINGIEATRRIHRTSPHIAILVLTVFDDDTLVFPAIRAGAGGYLLKNAEQEELLRAIRTVANGGAIFSPGIAQKVLGYLNAPQPNAPKDSF